jgi:hypothetical protein
MQPTENDHRYDSIKKLPHYQSVTRPHMSLYDRAAQFSPFAALTGYDDAVKETARLTDTKAELDEYEKAAINERLNRIQDTFDVQPEVSITYFLPDKKKSGGAYITVTGCVKKVDEYEHVVVMRNGTKVHIDDIAEIDGEIFEMLE